MIFRRRRADANVPRVSGRSLPAEPPGEALTLTMVSIREGSELEDAARETEELWRYGAFEFDYGLKRMKYTAISPIVRDHAMRRLYRLGWRVVCREIR